MLIRNMIKTLLLILTIILFSGCFNRNGVSAKYYSECKEYYDLQGFYHKTCDDDLVTYEEMGDWFKKEKPEPDGNVW